MPKIKTLLSTKVFTNIIFVSSFIFSLSASAALDAVLENNNPVSLFGIGVHQEKRFDIYVGALYAPESITDVSGLSDPYVAKRMSLKFLSKYSNRKMSRMWKQRIAMNNAKAKWRPLTKEIVQFASVFKRAMQEGDEVNIDYIPALGTKVYLNGTAFITIEKPEFFELLLNIWLGSVPPTERFKIGISGANPADVQSELVAKYDSLLPTKGRFDADLSTTKTQVAAVEKPKPPITKVPQQTVKKKTPAKKQESKPVVTKTQPAPSNVKEQTPQSVAEQSNNTASNRTKPDVSAIDDRKDLFKTDLGAKKVAEVKPKEVNKEAKQASNQQAVKTTPQVPIRTQVAKLDPPEEFFDVDLLSGSYTQELINTIKKYQSYPKKALAAGEEGNVTALVTIDKDGEIVEYEITERAASRTLNREVLRMIRRASPFPKIPPELKMEQFEFEVPMNFKLSQ